MSEKYSLINQVTIIGLGLIGSSLARIMKEKGLARRIIGCSHSIETLNKAKELGIIHVGSLSAADAVKRSDMVILCTPLSTYGSIMEQIAPALKLDCILTDVGSVKKSTIETVTPYLRQGQFFIPAHPIAGSEKSGIDAGNTGLFQEKKVIITPASGYHGKAACDKVTRLWEACGASIELIRPEKHDSLYAEMSHAVQIIAYAYALGLEKSGNETINIIAQQRDETFLQFNRLSGSDPVMWRDIVMSNKDEILTALGKFNYRLRGLVHLIEKDSLDGFLKDYRKQMKIRAKLKGPVAAPVKRSYATNTPYFAAAVALPAVIACALSEAFIHTDFAGTGFFSLTEPLLYEDHLTEKRLKEHQQNLLTNAESMMTSLQSLMEQITFGDVEALTASFERSNAIYQALSTLS